MNGVLDMRVERSAGDDDGSLRFADAADMDASQIHCLRAGRRQLYARPQGPTDRKLYHPGRHARSVKPLRPTMAGNHADGPYWKRVRPAFSAGSRLLMRRTIKARDGESGRR